MPPKNKTMGKTRAAVAAAAAAAKKKPSGSNQTSKRTATSAKNGPASKKVKFNTAGNKAVAATTTAATTTVATAPSDDAAYPKDNDSKIRQYLFRPDRVREQGGDWWLVCQMVAPLNTPPPWKSAMSKRFYCLVCSKSFKKSLSNSDDVKEHCNSQAHLIKVSTAKVFQIQVAGKDFGADTVSAVDLSMSGVKNIATIPKSAIKGKATVDLPLAKTNLYNWLTSSKLAFQGYAEGLKPLTILFQTLCPSFMPPSVAEVNMTVNKACKEKIESWATVIKKQKSVALAVSQEGPYMSVVARYLTEQMESKSVCLAIADHSDHTVCSAISMGLQNFSIDAKKISQVTLGPLNPHVHMQNGLERQHFKPLPDVQFLSCILTSFNLIAHEMLRGLLEASSTDDLYFLFSAGDHVATVSGALGAIDRFFSKPQTIQTKQLTDADIDVVKSIRALFQPFVKWIKVLEDFDEFPTFGSYITAARLCRKDIEMVFSEVIRIRGGGSDGNGDGDGGGSTALGKHEKLQPRKFHRRTLPTRLTNGLSSSPPPKRAETGTNPTANEGTLNEAHTRDPTASGEDTMGNDDGESAENNFSAGDCAAAIVALAHTLPTDTMERAVGNLIPSIKESSASTIPGTTELVTVNQQGPSLLIIDAQSTPRGVRVGAILARKSMYIQDVVHGSADEVGYAVVLIRRRHLMDPKSLSEEEACQQIPCKLPFDMVNEGSDPAAVGESLVPKKRINQVGVIISGTDEVQNDEGKVETTMPIVSLLVKSVGGVQGEADGKKGDMILLDSDDASGGEDDADDDKKGVEDDVDKDYFGDTDEYEANGQVTFDQDELKGRLLKAYDAFLGDAQQFNPDFAKYALLDPRMHNMSFAQNEEEKEAILKSLQHLVEEESASDIDSPESVVDEDPYGQGFLKLTSVEDTIKSYLNDARLSAQSQRLPNKRGIRDPREWWRDARHKYHGISSVAMKWLAVPVLLNCKEQDKSQMDERAYQMVVKNLEGDNHGQDVRRETDDKKAGEEKKEN